LEKQIHGRDGKLTVNVRVRERKEKGCPFNGKSSLFHHLADDGFLGGFTDIGKASWEVKCTLARFLGSPYHQEFLMLIEDKVKGSSEEIAEYLKAINETLAEYVSSVDRNIKEAKRIAEEAKSAVSSMESAIENLDERVTALEDKEDE
jgi:ubiquinone biosynthesis protein UbiJ